MVEVEDHPGLGGPKGTQRTRTYQRHYGGAHGGLTTISSGLKARRLVSLLLHEDLGPTGNRIRQELTIRGVGRILDEPFQ